MTTGIDSWFEEVKNTSKFLYTSVSSFEKVYLMEGLKDAFLIRSPGKAFVEGDASSASYFLAGAAVTGGTVTVEGCGTSSLQVFIAPFFFSFCLMF